MDLLGKTAGCDRNLPGAHFLKEKHMKTLVFALATLVALAGTAMAQQPPAPTVQSTAEDANRIIGALQTQRNNALDQSVSAQAATAKVQAELAAAKKEIEDLKAKVPAAPVLDGPAK